MWLWYEAQPNLKALFSKSFTLMVNIFAKGTLCDYWMFLQYCYSHIKPPNVDKRLQTYNSCFIPVPPLVVVVAAVVVVVDAAVVVAVDVEVVPPPWPSSDFMVEIKG